MAQLADIQSSQNKLEETFNKRMAILEAQLHVGGGAAKDTVARVAEEFRTFREVMLAMLHMLRDQINQCTSMVDNIETRHRRKALLILGVPEVASEDCTTAVLEVFNKTLALGDISASSITACHRIGTPKKDHQRPILVKFTSVQIRSSVWSAKSRLRGTSVSVKEFLTRSRQLVFGRARQHFGMRECWTQDGTIVVKLGDGSRCKLTTSDELNTLIKKHPKVAESSSSTRRGVAGSAGASSANSKQRRQ